MLSAQKAAKLHCIPVILRDLELYNQSVTKMFKFLNQCFARLRFWKSVSDSQNLLDGATAVLLETLFQNRGRAKH